MIKLLQHPKYWLFGLSLATMACSNAPQKEAKADPLPYYNEATFTPLWLEAGSAEVKALHKIPSFSLLNQDGQTISEKDFEDKVYVADFFFTSCPGICPKMTENMNWLQDVFKEEDDLLLLSHSVTPEFDSVPILKHYAQTHAVISGKWHLVTGPQSEIYELGRKAYFVEEDLGLERTDSEFLHTENFVLIDQNRHIRGIYNGLNKASVQQLIKDIHNLLGTKSGI